MKRKKSLYICCSCNILRFYVLFEWRPCACVDVVSVLIIKNCNPCGC